MGRNQMKAAADNIRVLTAAMVEKAKSGHPGGAMGGADFVNVLYSEFYAVIVQFIDRFARHLHFTDCKYNKKT